MTTILIISSLLAFLFFWTVFTFLLALKENRNVRTNEVNNRTDKFIKIICIVKTILLELFSFLGVILLYPFGVFNKTGQNKTYGRQIPILLIHGYLHNRGVFIPLKARLLKDKIPNIFSISMKPTFASIRDLAGKVKEKVEEIVSLTGCEKINMVTHSMGGLVAMYYIKELGGCSRVNLCITLACPHKGTKIARIALGRNGREMRLESDFLNELNGEEKEYNKKIISLWSDIDNIIVPSDGAVLDGAKNIKIENLGHVAFLFSPRVYKIIKENLI